MAKIISIGTAVPQHRHPQADILKFMQRIYALDASEERKLRFLYGQSGIEARYSIIPDYGRQPGGWEFYSPEEALEPFPSLELRMKWYQKYAPELSISAIENCLSQTDIVSSGITHLITVSCTGMSAPGLDLQIAELLELPSWINRTSINFMGCYAALQGLRQANLICNADSSANVLLVCTELCTLHFQKLATPDNIASALLFGDGAAAVLISGATNMKGTAIHDFYSEYIPKGKGDMCWELSSTGFLMTLSGYVPDLISTDIAPFMHRALDKYGISRDDVNAWCIHPGGKRILQSVSKSLGLPNESLDAGYQVLQSYGNMSSPTILFVLKEMLAKGVTGNIIGTAFGPGITIESCLLEAGVS